MLGLSGTQIEILDLLSAHLELCEWIGPTPNIPPIPGGGGGVGGIPRDVERQFSLREIECDKTAESIIDTMKEDFSVFANFSGTVGALGLPLSPAILQFGQAPITIGSEIPIRLTVLGAPGIGAPGTPTINYATSVIVIATSPTHFTFKTVPGHVLYPGTISFTATNVGDGRISFSIDVNADFAGTLAMLGFYFGGQWFEEDTWENVLSNVKKECQKNE